MVNPGYSISKTSFLKFEQCQKAFFLYKNHPYLRDKISVDRQLTFKRGHDVGFFAQQLFPGGIDVSVNRSAIEARDYTASLIENKTPVIYEATFTHRDVLVMVDILTLENGKYTAYEVKSSIRVSETYLKDACLQYYVLKNALPGFDDLFLVSLNPDYVLQGEVEPKKLFRRRSIKPKAEENLSYFDHQVGAAHLLLEQNAIPNIAIGKQCFRPYQCDYFGTCWKDAIGENSIFNLPMVDKTRLFEWFSSGIKTIGQVKDSLLEKEALIRIKNAVVKNEPFIDLKKIGDFLAGVTYPIAAMDMEIWSPAIPQIQNTKPFEQIPFLVCFYDGRNFTHHFLSGGGDDRKDFAMALGYLSENYATILVYDKTMEVGMIDNLLRLYPEFKEELEKLKSKLLDVFDIFLGLDYYHPAFKNNFSLKTVSAVLLNEVSYSKITSGLEAMSYYEQYRSAETEEEKQNIRSELVNYCNTDSLATYKLFKFLQTLILRPTVIS